MRSCLLPLLITTSIPAYAQSSRTSFIEGTFSPGRTISGTTGRNLGLYASAGLRNKSLAAELSIGDLLFREEQTTTAHAAFASFGARLFIPSYGAAEAFFRASIGGGVLFDTASLTSTNALINSFGAGVQYKLNQHQTLGAVGDLYTVQPADAPGPSLAAGALSLRFGYSF